jgi:putative acetyltransferase
MQWLLSTFSQGWNRARLRRGHVFATAIAAIYREAVLGTGPTGYGSAQVSAWATYPADPADFADQLSTGFTIVAVQACQPVAFGQLDPADTVPFLYCLPKYSRRGIATASFLRLEEEAGQRGRTRIGTDARRISRPLLFRETRIQSQRQRGGAPGRQPDREISHGQAAAGRGSSEWRTAADAAPTPACKPRDDTAGSKCRVTTRDQVRLVGHRQ